MARELRRLRLPPGSLDRDPIEIVGIPLRHLHVLRLRRGDRLCLLDGEGGELEAELISVGRRRARAAPLRRLPRGSEPPLECWLVQALPVRLQRMDLVVRQATEVGAARILPVLAHRSQHRTGRALLERARRWQRIAAAATEQCGRLRVPAVDEPRALTELPWDRLPRPAFILEPGRARDSWRQALAGAPAPAAATLMVGPEGGWTAAEVEEAARHGARPVRLGPRVLRSDTAGVAALAVLLHAWGDLG